MSEGGRRRRQPACGPERDISALCDITKGQHPQQTSFFQRKKERKPKKSMKGSGGWTVSGGSSSHRCSQSELGVMQATAACSARSDGCVEVQSKRVRERERDLSGPFRTCSTAPAGRRVSCPLRHGGRIQLALHVHTTQQRANQRPPSTLSSNHTSEQIHQRTREKKKKEKRKTTG